MTNRAEFRKRADRSRDLASKAKSQEAKQVLLDLSRTWERMAQQIDAWRLAHREQSRMADELARNREHRLVRVKDPGRR
jgi:hypothetical protein